MTGPFDFLVLATQYSFEVAFAGMAAATVYFVMERHNLTPETSAVASLSAMITLVAAINYFTMKDIVGLDGQPDRFQAFPTDYRYIDWLITTPLILAVFPILVGGRRFDRGTMARLVLADIVMIVCGYVGEVSINRAGGGTGLGWWMFLVAAACWFYILYVLFAEIGQAIANQPGDLADGFGALRYFVVIGWVVYPVGYLVAAMGFKGDLLIWRELVYCLADLINKVGFGMMAVSLAKRQSIQAWERSRH